MGQKQTALLLTGHHSLNPNWALSSVVERCIHIAKVVGSIPTVPSLDSRSKESPEDRSVDIGKVEGSIPSSPIMTITLDDFKKLEIRIGKVISAERVPDSDKLVKFVFDMGTEERQILAGIAEFFPDFSVLIGREMPVLVNLEPRVMRGHTSYGMILAADGKDSPVLLYPAQEVPPGSVVR